MLHEGNGHLRKRKIVPVFERPASEIAGFAESVSPLPDLVSILLAKTLLALANPLEWSGLLAHLSGVNVHENEEHQLAFLFLALEDLIQLFQTPSRGGEGLRDDHNSTPRLLNLLKDCRFDLNSSFQIVVDEGPYLVPLKSGMEVAHEVACVGLFITDECIVNPPRDGGGGKVELWPGCEAMFERRVVEWKERGQRDGRRLQLELRCSLV